MKAGALDRAPAIMSNGIDASGALPAAPRRKVASEKVLDPARGVAPIFPGSCETLIDRPVDTVVGNYGHSVERSYRPHAAQAESESVSS
jgi:hypothetical protein